MNSRGRNLSLRVLRILVVLLLALTPGLGPGAAAAQGTQPSGLKGDGTQAVPYAVYSAGDLSLVNGYNAYYSSVDQQVYYELRNNVDLSAYTPSTSYPTGWVPIGDPVNSAHFTGVFLGNGYAITGLTVVDDGSLTDDGLFGFVAPGGEIENVSLTVSQVTSGNHDEPSGGLVGVNDGTISGCTVAVSGTVVSNLGFAGGLAGRNWGTISGCTVTGPGSVSSSFSAGGLAGANSGTSTGSNASVNVTGSGSASQFTSLGGLVGYNDGHAQGSTAAITDSAAAGSVIGSVYCYSGGLVGYNDGSGGSTAAITDSTATGGVTGSAHSYNGGLVGFNDGDGGTVTITDSFATGGVTGSGSCENGGLVGVNDGDKGHAVVWGSYATGSVTGSGGYNDDGGLAGANAGGLLGYNSGDGGTATITGSYATGEVTDSSGLPSKSWVGGLVGWNTGYGGVASIAHSWATGSVFGNWNAGGLTGLNDGKDGSASIAHCDATGGVTGSGLKANGGLGGLVGHNDGDGSIGAATIGYSYATGAVSGSNESGGLAGINEGNGGDAQIFYSYAVGTVSGTVYAGGLAGLNDGNGGWAYIGNTYAVGAVSGSAYAGGLVGYNENNAAIDSSYWDTQASGQPAAGGGISTTASVYGQTTAAMQQADTFYGWDFSSYTLGIWGINEGYSYPYLMDAPYAPPTVTGLSPDSGPGGTSVTIDGTGLSGATAVYFGSNEVHFSVTRDASGDAYLATVSPAGGGSVDVVVRTPAGPSATGSGDRFTYTSGGGGGPSVSSTQATTTVSMSPSTGGTVALGTEASVSIPPGALQGDSSLEVAIQSLTSYPAAPQGETVVGAFGFTVGGQDHYQFTKDVTLTFHFDSSRVPQGATPAVYYYDGTKWVLLGGNVDWTNDTITTTVDHFTEYAVMAQVPANVPVVTLSDIAGNRAYADIEKLVSIGAITGYPDGTFRPNNDITRAEFVTVLVRTFKLTPKAGPVFVDTKGNWAQSYISTAAADGIVTGFNATHFGPNDLITREQMTAMVVRAAKLTPVSGQLTFKDAARIDPWARGYVVTAVKDGMVNGYPDDTFRPLAYVTRGEAATVIAGIANRIIVLTPSS